jgi:hypothetical protein
MEEKVVGPCNRNQGEQRAHPPSPSSLIKVEEEQELSAHAHTLLTVLAVAET